MVKISLVAAAVFGLCASVFAQEKPAPVFEISACNLSDLPLPPLYLEATNSPEGAPKGPVFQPLDVPANGRGPIVKVPFRGPETTIYTGSYDKDGKPLMKPFLSVPAKVAWSRLLLVAHRDGKGAAKTTFIDESLKSHPARTVRAVNLTNSKLAISVGADPQFLSVGGELVAEPKMNPDDRFSFVYYEQLSANDAYTAPTKMLYFPSPDTRLLVVFSYVEEKVADGPAKPDGTQPMKNVYLPKGYRMYDSVSGLGTAP